MSSPPPALPLILTVLISSAAVAGCVAPELEPPAANAYTPDSSPEASAARTENETRYTTDDWFLLSTPRSPTGHVRAFEWQIPKGAVQHIPGGPPLPLMYLEFVPVAPRFHVGEDWTLYGFRDHDGQADLVFALTGPTTTIEDHGATPPAVRQQPPPHYGATLLVIGENLNDGDRLFFILVGYGPRTEELGFAFRIADATEPPAPANNFTEFVADESGPPVRPKGTYDGDGSHDAYYGARFIPGGEQHRTFTDTIDHSRTTIAHAQGAHVVREDIASTAPNRTGWSLAYAGHEAFVETSYWSLDIATQDVKGRHNSAAADDPIGLTSTLTTYAAGQPKALFMADGHGESRVRLTLDRASVGTATAVQHHQLPDTLETMTGVPSATYDRLSTGRSDDLPWIGILPPT